jgi:2-polyprenyl-3-methyl-5-hydroxy-6-metoxy-1,4-benzoquinol methylase
MGIEDASNPGRPESGFGAPRSTRTPEEVAAQRGPFAGREGQLEAPYQVTPMPVVERMLDLAGVAPGVRLVDLGCGDGRIVIAAARRGARALGIDIDPARIACAEAAARESGVQENARFAQGDLFAADLSDADVVTLFLLGHVNAWLEGKLRSELKPGARVAGYAFPMPNWAPTAEEAHDRVAVYLWTR